MVIMVLGELALIAPCFTRNLDHRESVCAGNLQTVSINCSTLPPKVTVGIALEKKNVRLLISLLLTRCVTDADSLSSTLKVHLLYYLLSTTWH